MLRLLLFLYIFKTNVIIAQNMFYLNFHRPLPPTTFGMFLLILSSMLLAFHKKRHHETFAHCIFLLCEDAFLGDVDCRQYYLHVWGCLGVTMARLYRTQTVVNSCLGQMEQVNQKNIKNCKLFSLRFF